MKRPLLSFAIFCSLLSGILIFCVVAGGYTNLLRAQNRIGAAKGLVTTQCQKRMDLIPELIAMAQKIQSQKSPESSNSDQSTLNPVNTDRVNIDQINIHRVKEADKKAKIILARINSMEHPMDKELLLVFEQSQVRLGREISLLIQELKKNEAIKTFPDLTALEYDFEQLGITIFVSSSRYNKEARYFNHRKTGVFGSLIAKLFGFEKTHFFEITASLFQQENNGAGTGAS